MSESDPIERQADDARTADLVTAAADHAETSASPPRGVRGFFRHVQAIGRDAASIARGRLPESSDEQREPGKPGEQTLENGERKVGMLHVAAERLRGAADTYIAAKLDEIEARVDSKLDHIEDRIDEKMLELHRQLRDLRDRELRHRLRLLKITLVFTVLVAALSLGYKLLVNYLAG